MGLTAAAGALLGLLRLRLSRQRGLRIDAVDAAAAAVLRMLGVPTAVATRLVSLPLQAADPLLAA